MAHVVVMGAGIAGLSMAYEIREICRPEDRVIVISKDARFHFVHSNELVAVK